MNPLLLDQLVASHVRGLLADADRRRTVRRAAPSTRRDGRLRRALTGVRRLLPPPVPRQACCV